MIVVAYLIGLMSKTRIGSILNAPRSSASRPGPSLFIAGEGTYKDAAKSQIGFARIGCRVVPHACESGAQRSGRHDHLIHVEDGLLAQNDAQLGQYVLPQLFQLGAVHVPIMTVGIVDEIHHASRRLWIAPDRGLGLSPAKCE